MECRVGFLPQLSGGHKISAGLRQPYDHIISLPKSKGKFAENLTFSVYDSQVAVFFECDTVERKGGKNMFTPIESSNWPRREMFYYFSKMAPTGYSLMVTVDVTKLREAVKAAVLLVGGMHGEIHP